MKLVNILKAWKDYPIILFEKAENNPEQFLKYKTQDLAYKIGETLVSGGMTFYLTQNPIMAGMAVAAPIIIREEQLRRYFKRTKTE